MALDTSRTLGAMTGARYIESLKDGREVWLDGEKIQDITTHPAFTGIVHELARIYDLQHTEKYQDDMTFISPETGNRCSVSWLLPGSIEDLKKKTHFASTQYSEDDVTSADFIDRFTDDCIAISPFIGFLTRSIGLPY